jgi:hypothetical protein
MKTIAKQVRTGRVAARRGALSLLSGFSTSQCANQFHVYCVESAGLAFGHPGAVFWGEALGLVAPSERHAWLGGLTHIFQECFKFVPRPVKSAPGM